MKLPSPATGFSLARPSMLVSGRLPSSLVRVNIFLAGDLAFLVDD